MIHLLVGGESAFHGSKLDLVPAVDIPLAAHRGGKEHFVPLACLRAAEIVSVAMSEIAYVAIGSNLNDPVFQVSRAIQALSACEFASLLRASSLYASAPMGGLDQPTYVNAVVSLRCDLPPEMLLSSLLSLESSLGRERKAQRWASRQIDLDLLCYGSHRCDTSSLTLPHPGLVDRVFVLSPLSEIAPEMRLPSGRSPQSQLSALGLARLQPLSDTDCACNSA